MSLALDGGLARGQTSVLHHSHRMYKWLVLGNVVIGTFMAVLDSTIVNVGLPKIMATFGVALFGTLLTRRVMFHTASYGIAVNEHSAAFQKILHGLEHFSQHAVGGSMAQSSLRGRGLIISHVMKQAFVSAVNDDFLIAGGITILCLVPIFFLRKKRFHSGAKAAAVEL